MVEEARHLAGEKPETVPADKRQEILAKLKAAVASFRHSLELEPENARARRDIEPIIGNQVFLDLRVKVEKNWTKNPDFVRRISEP